MTEKSVEQQARQAALNFRIEHRLGNQPLGDLAALIEQTTGYDVAVLDVDPDQHGLVGRDTVRNAVFIAVARTRHPMRQRSTLAHELGHLIFDDWDDEDVTLLRSPDEIRADAFARHLLVPTDGVKELLGEYSQDSEQALSMVVHWFLVSPAIAAIAMRDAGYVSHQTAETWMRCGTPHLATRYGWRDHYASLQDDSFRLRAPQSLVARAVDGYAEGVVSAQTIATLRSMSVDAVLAEMAEAGITPASFDASEMDLEDLPDVDIDLDYTGDEGSAP